MTRLARIVIAGLPHHVTKGGNRREALFLQDGDKSGQTELILKASALE